MNEEELYKLEIELIKKHHSVLGKVKSRPIKIIRFKNNIVGRAKKNFLLLSERHVNEDSKEEIIETLCHELNHYATKSEGIQVNFWKI